MDNTSVSDITGKQKIFAILAYCGILWFLGMLNLIPSDVRESAYVKNHVNNGMILFICEMFLACIPFVGWACEVVIIALLVIIYQNQTKALPLGKVFFCAFFRKRLLTTVSEADILSLRYIESRYID